MIKIIDILTIKIILHCSLTNNPEGKCVLICKHLIKKYIKVPSIKV